MLYRRRRANARYSPYRRAAAIASAGTLGFIAGNIQGAYAGTRLARRTFKRRRVPRSTGVTTQVDGTTVYKRKRMPKYKRKAWRKFVKKVQAATQDRGTISFVMNGANAQLAPAATAGVNKQLIQFVHLYGKNGGVSATARDIGANDMRAMQGELAALLDDSSKVTFKSGVLDVTCTNQVIPEQSNYSGPLEVDIYHIVYPTKKQYPVTGMLTGFIDATSQSEAVDTLPKIEITDRGVTPFQCPQAISIMGCKIISKKKRFLQPGQSFTYQIRDPKNRVKELVTMRDKDIFYEPNITQTLMIVAKPTAIIAVDQVFSLITTATRTYSVQHEGGDVDRSRYFNNFTI